MQISFSCAPSVGLFYVLVPRIILFLGLTQFAGPLKAQLSALGQLGLVLGPNYHQHPKRPKETRRSRKQRKRETLPVHHSHSEEPKTISFHCYGGGGDLSGEGFVASCGSRDLRIGIRCLLPCWSEALVRPLL